MNFTIPEETILAIRKKKVVSKALHEEFYNRLDVEAETIDDKDLPVILSVAESAPHCEDIKNRRLARDVKAWMSLRENARGAKIKSLEHLESAIKKVVQDKKILFVYNDAFKAFLPYLVTKIEMTEARRGFLPLLHVELEARARGHTNTDKERLCADSLSFRQSDLKGLKKTVVELLESRGAHLWSEDLWKAHLEDLEIYHKIRTQSGGLYHATGTGILKGNSYWSRESEDMSYHGETGKVVIDDPDDYGTDSASTTSEFWGEEEVLELPDLPVVLAFHLQKHDFYKLHVRSLAPYPFDVNALEKIVLPKDYRTLLNNLTSSHEGPEDVVRGKGGGIIILSTGKPGTGKTLSAEVYAEATRKALYTVQCSQLGTDPDELEKALSTVLERAVRWKAILLIDEADVYIHSRGENLKQNAIVGVFLRLLEYYDGILFMTTNREVLVDDAIMSRVTAHLRYDHPSSDAALNIWKILLDHYGVQAAPRACLDRFGVMSGRRIRNIIRLAALSAQKEGKPAGLEHLIFAEKFQAREEMG